MKLVYIIIILGCISCTQHIYIARHAEKAAVTSGMSRLESSDPPLSNEGEVRAKALQARLQAQKIKYIFSTNYKRTKATATPLSTFNNIAIQTYSPAADSLSLFIEKIKSIRNGNILVVGHSNTVDDLANALTGNKVVAADLMDATYDQLFIISRRGNKYRFRSEKYGN